MRSIKKLKEELMNLTARSSLISKALEIEGWFDAVELDLLIHCVAEASARTSDSHRNLNIVEIGSHKGRSTVAMGLALGALSLTGTIYAVDPHEGKRSGRHDRIHRGPETYNDFLKNMTRYRLDKFVRCVRSKATETRIDIPISFILIDALHLFKNVSEDFHHFESNVIRNGLIAFHDYEEEFLGVVQFVNSLIYVKNAAYRKLYQAHSLIVLEKSDRTCVGSK